MSKPMIMRFNTLTTMLSICDYKCISCGTPISHDSCHVCVQLSSHIHFDIPTCRRPECIAPYLDFGSTPASKEYQARARFKGKELLAVIDVAVDPKRLIEVQATKPGNGDFGTPDWA